MDLHPLMTPNTVLTDALNASFITFNGNETMLQNDMGNTLIQDATTGYVMGLNSGFIPVGMKEHGGILYIASYNPDTEEGELGSIPSPIFEYTSEASNKEVTEDLIHKDDDTTSSIPTYQLSDLYDKKSVQISDNNFYLGDSIFPIFDITTGPTVFTRTLYQQSGNIPVSHDFNLITKVNGVGSIQYGMFNIVPWLHPLQNSTPVRLKEWEEKGIYYFSNDPMKDKPGGNADQISDTEYRYWFSTVSTIDDGVTRASQFFYNIPNVNSGGKLYVTAEEVPAVNDVKMFSLRSTKDGSPYYFIV